MSIQYVDGKPKVVNKTIKHEIPPEKINQPRRIDIGTQGLYLGKVELTWIEKALNIARDEILTDEWDPHNFTKNGQIERQYEALERYVKEVLDGRKT